jgi:hypothetical protein
MAQPPSRPFLHADDVFFAMTYLIEATPLRCYAESVLKEGISDNAA